MNKVPLVTILIPNYKTPLITKICLRLIRKHTDLSKAEVIVIDNQSEDESINYLRNLSWITLVERRPEHSESVYQSHSRALDLALSRVKTPYVLCMHTDTFVKSDDWLNVLLAPFKDNPNLAGVGSWKLESKNRVRTLGIQFEQIWKKALHQWFGYKGFNSERMQQSKYYLRSHCAVYRMDLITKLGSCFSDGDQTAGKVLHEKMVAAGYEMLFLESAYLGKYVDHLNHATMILNPQLGTGKKNLREGKKRISVKLRGIDISKVMSEDYLDE